MLSESTSKDDTLTIERPSRVMFFSFAGSFLNYTYIENTIKSKRFIRKDGRPVTILTLTALHDLFNSQYDNDRLTIEDNGIHYNYFGSWTMSRMH